MDDSTMAENVKRLGELVIGHRIVAVDEGTIDDSAISNSPDTHIRRAGPQPRQRRPYRPCRRV